MVLWKLPRWIICLQFWLTKLSKRLFCPACGEISSETKLYAVVAPWVRELTGNKDKKTIYFVCSKCKTGWADIFYSSKEMQNLYQDYRGVNYLRVRSKWESTYSANFNSSIDSGDAHLNLRKSQMEEIITTNFYSFTTNTNYVLDIGGGHGGLMPNWPKILCKYVLDVSGVETQLGITSVSSWNEISVSYPFDLIMVCGVLEHLTQPSKFLEETRVSLGNLNLATFETLFYFEVPGGVPYRKKMFFKFIWAFLCSLSPYFWNRYDKVINRKGIKNYPLRIAEHLQFFTPIGLRELLESNGFEVIDQSEFDVKDSLFDSDSVRFSKVINVIAKLKK